ncbi:MAG: SPASM domain-containing protein, partial [Bacteroidales bacterium]|nr:SPASM domain-containing protein [Bacteroidales bacterium]
NGDVMPCGRFCDDDLRQFAYGNLHDETLSEILPRIKKSEIYKRAEYITQSDCAKCKWYNICHGGCLHDGFLRNGDFKSKTLLCPAYMQIFAHIERRMQEVGILEQSNQCITNKNTTK